jgi:hypothetical protein
MARHHDVSRPQGSTRQDLISDAYSIRTFAGVESTPIFVSCIRTVVFPKRLSLSGLLASARGIFPTSNLNVS